MKLFKILCVLAVLLSLGAPLATADDFTGLWEGIDDEDGSEIVISIIGNEPFDGVFKILWREGHFFRCEKRGEGIIIGEAYSPDPDGTSGLDVDAQIYCLDGSKGAVPVRPLLFLSHNGTVLATANGSLTLHRISSR